MIRLWTPEYGGIGITYALQKNGCGSQNRLPQFLLFPHGSFSHVPFLRPTCVFGAALKHKIIIWRNKT